MADIDYGEAFKVAGGGFGTTFLILIILALSTLVLRFVSTVIDRNKKEEETENSEA